jgi:hypothetical protein
MQAALKNFRLLFLEAMLSCLCSALLPPAPCGTSDDRVPLAIVTVRKKDCKILRVCNWTSLRKMVITFPTLEYWLSWIPYVRSIQDIIGRFCCADVETRTVGTVGTVGMVAGEKIDYGSVGSAADGTATDMANPALDHQYAMDNMTLTTLMMNAFARGSDPIDAASMVDEVFGLSTPDKPTLSEDEKANVAPFLLLNEVLRPVVQSLVPESLSAEKQPLNVVDTVMNGGDKQASIYQRIEALEKAIAELKPQ